MEGMIYIEIKLMASIRREMNQPGGGVRFYILTTSVDAAKYRNRNATN